MKGYNEAYQCDIDRGSMDIQRVCLQGQAFKFEENKVCAYLRLDVQSFKVEESMVYAYLGPEDSCMSASEEEIEVLDPLLFEPDTFNHFQQTTVHSLGKSTELQDSTFSVN